MEDYGNVFQIKFLVSPILTVFLTTVICISLYHTILRHKFYLAQFHDHVRSSNDIALKHKVISEHRMIEVKEAIMAKVGDLFQHFVGRTE
jgi:hypothetical protein